MENTDYSFMKSGTGNTQAPQDPELVLQVSSLVTTFVANAIEIAGNYVNHARRNIVLTEDIKLCMKVETFKFLEEDNTEKIKLEIVPLKKSDNENKAIFIVDEAQLISDNYHQSIDLRFGSGKLLEDFIKFSDLKNSNRKIIFIGDSFQLSIGKKEENTLNPEYIKEKYEFKTKAFQLIDKEDNSEIIKL